MPQPRKPKALKVFEGNRSREDLDAYDEPTPKGQPTKPADLTGEAAEFWDEYIPQLVEIGIATALDSPVLAQLCRAWARLRTAERNADADPLDKDSRIAVCQYGTAFDKLSMRFGFSPVDRAKIRLEPKKTKNGIEELLA